MVTQKNVIIFFERHRSFSKIGIIWISKILATSVHKVELLPKSFSDHNPVTFRMKNDF